jgi:hypothetical protein
MNYSDYISWKSKLSYYTGGICPADCISNFPCNGTGSNAILPTGRYFSDYLFYNNLTSSWQIGSDSVHLGAKAGGLGIGYASVAIGESANARNNFSIAIGKSTNVGGTNTIAINATGSTFTTNQNNSFFVSPVRPATSINVLYYDPFSKEITYGAVPVSGSGSGSGSITSNGIPDGATQYGEYLYFNGTTWAIGSDKINIGAGAGATGQTATAIAIGSNAGNLGQATGAIAIGTNAGKSNQGQNSVAIGSKAGTMSQHSNTIIINATGGEVNSEGISRLYVKPIREAAATKALYYDVSSGEVTFYEPYDGSDMDDTSQWSIFKAKQTVDMSGFRIGGLGEPVSGSDAVTKDYLLSQLRDASDALPLGGGTMLGEIDMSGRRILRVSEPMMTSDAATKNYVDSVKTYVDTLVPLGSEYGEYLYHDGVKWAVGGTSVNLGLNAGMTEVGDDTVAIGREAGKDGQGDYSIAIGARAGQTNQADKSIIINATGITVNADISGAFYVKPVREVIKQKIMYYNDETGEITYGDLSGNGVEANGGRIGTNTLYNNTYIFHRYPYGLNINDGKTVANGQATEQDTIANAFAKVDDWLHTYLIAQPPLPKQLQLVKKATVTSVFLALQNPIQIKTAVFKKKLPLIEQVSIDICNNNINYTVLSNNLEYIPDISEINVIVISKVPVTPAYRTVELTVSGEISPRTFKAYYYYNAGIAESTATSNLIKFWYSNYSELSPNVLTVLLPTFATGSAPGTPRILIFTNIGQGTFRADWIEPEFSDLENEIKSSDFDSPLLYYNLKYAGIDTVRYGGVVNLTQFTVTGIVPTELTLPYIGTFVHPGTKYNVSIVSYNNITPTTGPEISGSIITLYPTAPPAFSTKSVSFTTNYNYNSLTENIRKIYGNTSTAYINIILKSYTNSSSTTITNIPIHSYSNNFQADKLINTESSIMKLSGIYNNALNANVNFNEITFNGFNGASPVSTGTSTTFELIYSNIKDYYASDVSYNKGFYLTTDAYILYKANQLTATHNSYYIILNQTLNNNVISSIQSNSFFLDDIQDVPIINNCILQYNESNFIKISGVNVLNPSMEINTITDISNLASYFYITNNLMRYELRGDANNLISTINITNIEDRSNYISSLFTLKNYEFKFNTVKLNVNFNNLFTKQINLSLRARNLIGYSSIINIVRNIIIDTASITNINLYNMNEIPTLNLTEKSGRLNTSDVNGLFNLDIFSNFRNKYDLSQNILLNTTLQIYGGKFSSRLFDLSNGYLNYSSVGGLNIEYNESIDYSTVPSSGYRYATFIWKITTDSPNYEGRIQFKINEISGNIPTINDQGVSINGNNMLFYYRIENIANPDVLSQDRTTVWINGNKVNSSTEPVTSYRNADIAFNGLLGGRSSGDVVNSIQLINNNNDMLYTLIFPLLLNIASNNVYIYTLVGIPMNSSFGFKNISAYLIPSS